MLGGTHGQGLSRRSYAMGRLGAGQRDSSVSVGAKWRSAAGSGRQGGGGEINMQQQSPEGAQRLEACSDGSEGNAVVRRRC